MWYTILPTTTRLTPAFSILPRFPHAVCVLFSHAPQLQHFSGIKHFEHDIRIRHILPHFIQYQVQIPLIRVIGQGILYKLVDHAFHFRLLPFSGAQEATDRRRLPLESAIDL